MNDDENSQVIKQTNLSDEAPTGRATVHSQLEKTELKVSKSGIETKSETKPGSALNKAQTTMWLTVAISTITLVAWGIGITAIGALATGGGATIALYLLIYFTDEGRRRKE